MNREVSFFQAHQAVVTFSEAVRRKMSRLKRNNFFYGIAKSFYSFDLCSALYMIIKSMVDPCSKLIRVKSRLDPSETLSLRQEGEGTLRHQHQSCQMLMHIDLTNRLSGRRANITKCERRSVLSRLLPLNSDIRQHNNTF